MNNRGEGRVWKLAGILLSCWEWPLSWARSRYCQQEVSSCQMTRHSGSAWTTLLPAPILRLGIRSVQLPSIKAIIGTRACTVTLRRSIYRGKVRGRTSMMLRFDRLVKPDGRRSQIHAEIVELTMRLPVKQSISKARSNPVAEDGKASNTPSSVPERAPYWVESSAAARAQGLGRSLGCGRVGHDRLPWPSEDHAQ